MEYQYLKFLLLLFFFSSCEIKERERVSLDCSDFKTNTEYYYNDNLKFYVSDPVEMNYDTLTITNQVDLLSHYYLSIAGDLSVFSEDAIDYFLEDLTSGYIFEDMDYDLSRINEELKPLIPIYQKIEKELKKYYKYSDQNLIVYTNNGAVSFKNFSRNNESLNIDYLYLGYLDELNSHLIRVIKYFESEETGFMGVFDDYAILLNNDTQERFYVNDRKIYYNKNLDLFAAASFAYGGYYGGGKIIQLFKRFDTDIYNICLNNMCYIDPSIIGWKKNSLYLSADNEGQVVFTLDFIK